MEHLKSIGTSSAMILEVISMQINWLMKHTKIKILGLRSNVPSSILLSNFSRSILTVANMGFFSSDRAIQTYCDEIW